MTSTQKPSSSGRKSRSKDDTANPDVVLASIGNYVFQKTVGEGNFAKVKLAKHKLTGAEVAIKIIDKTTLDEKKLNKLYREVRIMKLLHHPNIVKLYEVIETKNTVFLVMEYASGGELYDYLVVHGKMKEKEARAKFRQILSAVSYCHKKKVIHRDLKAENLLLDSNLDIKIADFGFSNHFDPDSKLDTFCGSPPYAAPELFQGRRYTGPEVDIWSLGVILYVLTTGCLPFDGKNLQEMRESVCRGKYRIPFYLSDSCEKLLRKFLIRDPYKRASLDMLIDDPWINEGYSDSPIDRDVSQTLNIDDTIIKLIEQRYKMDKETVIKSLKDNVYDDISAIYYLLYYEKETRGKIEGEVQAMGGSPTTSDPKASTTKHTIPVAAPPKAAPDMNKIAEDEVADEPTSLGGAARPLQVQKPRKRRVTVGVGDMEKLEKDDPQTAAMLKNTTKDDESAPMPTAAAPVNRSATSHGHSQKAEETKQPAAPQATPSSPPPAENSEGGAANSTRKRHNTIVGIFRNTIRRPSEVSQVPNQVPIGDNKAELQPLNNIPQENDADSEQNMTPNEPRSLRFTFNSNTTSSKPPDDIVQEVCSNSAKHNISFKLISRYVIECTFIIGGGAENLKFEIEICKLPRLKNLHGLKFKRLGGSSSDYRDICEKILGTIQL